MSTGAGAQFVPDIAWRNKCAKIPYTLNALYAQAVPLFVGSSKTVIIPSSSIPDVESVAAHYDDLDSFYRGVWGNHVHHGYWISGEEGAD
jgi:hypothetical protein